MEKGKTIGEQIFGQVEDILQKFAEEKKMILIPWYHGENKYVLRLRENKNKAIDIYLVDNNPVQLWPDVFLFHFYAEIFDEGNNRWDSRYSECFLIQSKIKREKGVIYKINYKVNLIKFKKFLKEAFTALS